MHADRGASAGPSSRRRKAPIASSAPMLLTCTRCVATPIHGIHGLHGRPQGPVSPASGPGSRIQGRRPWLARDPGVALVPYMPNMPRMGGHRGWRPPIGPRRADRYGRCRGRDGRAGPDPPLVGGGIRPVGPPTGSRCPDRPIRSIGIRHHGVLPPMYVRGRRRALPIAPISVSAPMLRSHPLSANHANHAEHGRSIDRGRLHHWCLHAAADEWPEFWHRRAAKTAVRRREAPIRGRGSGRRSSGGRRRAELAPTSVRFGRRPGLTGSRTLLFKPSPSPGWRRPPRPGRPPRGHRGNSAGSA